jgi:hypothetical protein
MWITVCSDAAKKYIRLPVMIYTFYLTFTEKIYTFHQVDYVYRINYKLEVHHGCFRFKIGVIDSK